MLILVHIFQRRQWHPTPVLLPGKSHGQRSLVGCSPWGREESDMTKRLHFHFSLSCIGEGNGSPLQRSCLENPREGGAWWAAVYGVSQSRTRLKRLSSSNSSKVVIKFLVDQLTVFLNTSPLPPSNPPSSHSPDPRPSKPQSLTSPGGARMLVPLLEKGKIFVMSEKRVTGSFSAWDLLVTEDPWRELTVLRNNEHTAPQCGNRHSRTFHGHCRYQQQQWQRSKKMCQGCGLLMKHICSVV